jgi:RNA polymerase sigma-32 factor
MMDPRVRHYVARAEAFSRLSVEEEAHLCDRWFRRHDQRARTKLIEANLFHVTRLAMRFRHYGFPIEELIAEGNVGLVYALEKFEPKRGHRFFTYAAWWVRAHVWAFVVNNLNIVGGGRLRSGEYFELRKALRAERAGGDNGLAERVAKRLGWTVEKVETLTPLVSRTDLSLDVAGFEDSQETIANWLPFCGPGPDELAEQADEEERNRAAVREALGTLDARERVAAETRLMVEHEDRERLDRLGARWGVTRQRAMQIDGRARRKLRDALRGDHGPQGLATGPRIAQRTNPCHERRGAPAVSATETPCHAATQELAVTYQTIIPDQLTRNPERMGRGMGAERRAF